MIGRFQMLSCKQFIEMISDEEIRDEKMIYALGGGGAVQLEWSGWAGIPMLGPGFKYLNERKTIYHLNFDNLSFKFRQFIIKI